MALFNKTYSQLCERCITKDERKKEHLYSSKPLHREVNGFWPAYFPQGKLTRDEKSILEKVFWDKMFGSKNISPVYGFLQINFNMVTNLNDYVTFPDDDDYDDFKYNFRENMTAQFKQDFYNKSFSHQDQDKRDDGLQKRCKFWPNYVVIQGGLITESVFE